MRTWESAIAIGSLVGAWVALVASAGWVYAYGAAGYSAAYAEEYARALDAWRGLLGG